MDAPSDDEDEVSTQEQQQALLEQMRALRASLERQDGVLKQRASSLEQQREAAQQELGRTALSIIDEVASAPSLVLDVARGERWRRRGHMAVARRLDAAEHARRAAAAPAQSAAAVQPLDERRA